LIRFHFRRRPFALEAFTIFLQPRPPRLIRHQPSALRLYYFRFLSSRRFTSRQPSFAKENSSIRQAGYLADTTDIYYATLKSRRATAAASGFRQAPTLAEASWS